MTAILKMELMNNAQDRGLYFWTFILPIMFMVLFITIFTSGSMADNKEEVILSIVPGYTVMFVFFIMISMCFSFIKDSDNGMIARLASTPLPSFSYLFGKWLSFMVIVMIQIIVMFIFGKVVYNVPLEQPFLLSLLSIILTISITGIGLALSLLVRTQNMGIAITQIITFGGAVMGGLWMPLELMPTVIQKIGKFTPQFWAHDAFKQAMTGTLNYTSFLTSLLILLGVGCIGFLIAWISYPTFLKRAKN